MLASNITRLLSTDSGAEVGCEQVVKVQRKRENNRRWLQAQYAGNCKR